LKAHCKHETCYKKVKYDCHRLIGTEM
jgi:hypothetical protein